LLPSQQFPGWQFLNTLQKQRGRWAELPVAIDCFIVEAVQFIPIECWPRSGIDRCLGGRL
jgi:hypothetical protein